MRGVFSVSVIAASGKSNVEMDAWGSNGLVLQDEMLICWEQLGRWRYVEASQFRSFKVSR
jgi:hypothetical protein